MFILSDTCGGTSPRICVTSMSPPTYCGKLSFCIRHMGRSKNSLHQHSRVHCAYTNVFILDSVFLSKVFKERFSFGCFVIARIIMGMVTELIYRKTNRFHLALVFYQICHQQSHVHHNVVRERSAFETWF